MSDATPTQAPGTPVWVDLGSPDPQASTRFYGQLFGWQAEDLGEEAGHYTMFRDGGKQVAAVGPLMMPGQPTVWSTYVKVEDAADIARRVTEAGGQVLAPPMAVMEEGTMAVFTDPAGAAFSVWQPARMKGAEKFNTPVSLTWNELQTRDPEGAKTFYPKVFGWGVEALANPMGEYIMWQVDGKPVAGGMAMGANIPPQVPPHWLVYFSVANTDEIINTAKALGGSVMSGPHDSPQGRFAVLTDPQGAFFAVIQNG